MKKILSLALAVLMLVSAVPMVYAAENETDYTNGTAVEYVATGTEQYTVTVPASLTPGNAGDVTAAGTWGSNRKLVVAADDSVKLTNSINSADYKDLAVTFADINLVGDNTQAVSETKQVSVADIENALFGTWRGTFYYDVEMVDVEMISFTIQLADIGSDLREYQAEKGMTWGQWLVSSYNTDEFTVSNDGETVVSSSSTHIKNYAVDGYDGVTISEEIIDGAEYGVFGVADRPDGW